MQANLQPVTLAEVLNLEVGDLAINCFGQLNPVTRIIARQKDRHGKWFVRYDSKYGKSAVMSFSIKEGEVPAVVGA
jgi:hypothetical protein